MTNQTVKITAKGVREYPLRKGEIALWWLGQSGYLVKSQGGTLIAVDPYLSNSCKAVGDAGGFNMDRLVPTVMDPADLVGIDVYAITHSHQDHLDPETVLPYVKAGGRGPFVAPHEAADALEKHGIQDNVQVIWPNKVIRFGDLTVRATFAIPLGPDDLTHVGYIVSIDDGPSVYFTGDTAYHQLIADSVAVHHPDIVVPVINACFRNMGPAEAAELAKQIDPKIVIPCHYDLFPDNRQYPELLRSNLRLQGIDDRYRCLTHGVPYVYPEW
jgi:L-ascorbate 6-phosphate lactonase